MEKDGVERRQMHCPIGFYTGAYLARVKVSFWGGEGRGRGDLSSSPLLFQDHRQEELCGRRIDAVSNSIARSTIRTLPRNLKGADEKRSLGIR